MALRTALLVATLMGIAQPPGSALACGDGEAPTACDDPSPNGFASWMLGRVAQALRADPAGALADFTAGTRGFRTADTYVFCVGPDGIMTAHPNPILKGHDVRDLHDRTGNHFIQTMLDTAKPGQIAVIHYLFPKPGSTIEEPKTTYYTKAGDQMCAVGVYDTDQAAPTAATPDGRIAQLRQKLDREIPSQARADWIAFLEALNAQGDAKAAAIAQARRDIRAATAALDSAGLKPAGAEQVAPSGPSVMALAQFLPLTEAATFTLGCAVLHATRIDPERVAIVLVLTAAILAVALLIGLTPADLAGDAVSLDPANLWPRLL